MIQRYLEISEHFGFNPKLILVNDGSLEGSVKQQAKRISKKIESLQYLELAENCGKGAALRAGVEQASSEHIIFTDVDFPYTVESISGIYHQLREGANVVIGTRDNHYYDSVPSFRKSLSKAFRWTLKILLRLDSNDTQCGLKGFDQEGKKRFLETTINRFLFDLEFVLYCSRSSTTKLSTVDVQLNEGVVFSKMPISILMKEGWNFIKILFRPSRK